MFARHKNTYVILSVILVLVLMLVNEWFYEITKSSYLNQLKFTEAVYVLASATFVVLLPTVLLSAILTPLVLIRVKGYSLYYVFIHAVFSILVSLLVLILIDNLTYTLFGFGTSSFRSNIARLVYLVLFLVSVGYFFHKIWRCQISRSVSWLLISSIIIVVGLISVTLFIHRDDHRQFSSQQKITVTRPYNVLILSTDGVNASSMSVYGYSKPTTPFLEQKKNEFLIFENSYTNNANTAGSVISLLTGVGPATSRVVFPPDTLTGRYMFDHLPGVFKSNDYHIHDESPRYYARASDFNLQLIGNDQQEGNILRRWYGKYLKTHLSLSDHSQLFLKQAIDKIRGKLGFMLFISYQENPYAEVHQIKKSFALHDKIRLKNILDVMAHNERFFIHVHFLGTHGPKFKIDAPFFSKGLEQKEKYQEPFYNDSIRQFDNYVRKVYQTLESAGRLDETVIIITSDHGKKLSYHERVPLLMRFPRGELAGHSAINSQRLDIAPTLLSYLGADQPDWFEGKNLLQLDQNDRYRRIFATKVGKVSVNQGEIFSANRTSLGFGSLGHIAMVVCNRIYELDINSGRLKSSDILGHSDICENSLLPNANDAAQTFHDYLSDRKYPVSKLPDIIFE